jgi:hypothetical protein
MGARPVYETPADMSREGRAVAALCAAWRCQSAKLPRFYPADAVLLRAAGEVAAFVEVKCRRHAFGKYPTLHLSILKVMKLSEMAAFTGIPALIVVGLEDAVYWRQVPAPSGGVFPFPVTIGGRRDRGDPDDVEPVFEIDYGSFRRVDW